MSPDEKRERRLVLAKCDPGAASRTDILALASPAMAKRVAALEATTGRGRGTKTRVEVMRALNEKIDKRAPHGMAVPEGAILRSALLPEEHEVPVSSPWPTCNCLKRGHPKWGLVYIKGVCQTCGCQKGGS